MAAQNTEELNEFQKVFNRFDTNGDGKISASELASVMEALGSLTSPDELQRMMAEIDTDGDGFIDLKEFTDFHLAAGVDVGAADELKEAFEMYDRNGNGLISAVELHMVLEKLGESCTVKDCERMIRSVDSDGDGNVNFEEFMKMMNSGGRASNS